MPTRQDQRLAVGHAKLRKRSQSVAHQVVGWANTKRKAISSSIMSICPPYFISAYAIALTADG
ncbi:hypothetical protein BJP36_39015 [Moorena producens JHB]|uniref:Uncharacterized protein n=1 Tax=Moorena producens (strain JHB) TaxID=1454205 RepID=A0A9Q9SUU7_MOOP1|nr:hypothetical protein [Moorena producens]WAN70058.1 hypothetical protein BJP36_39015 [Moorena producens JHB]